METCFYSIADVINTPNHRSQTEILWMSFRLIEPDMDDITQLKHFPHNPELETRLSIRGLYCLKVGGKIVSVAVIKTNTIDRIITIPRFRRKGYASLLIDIVTDRMKAHGVPFVFSPVKPEVFPLFEKLGWVRCGSGANDGTFDYCPAEDLNKYGTGQGYEYDAYPWYSHLVSQRG